MSEQIQGISLVGNYIGFSAQDYIDKRTGEPKFFCIFRFATGPVAGSSSSSGQVSEFFVSAATPRETKDLAKKLIAICDDKIKYLQPCLCSLVPAGKNFCITSISPLPGSK